MTENRIYRVNVFVPDGLNVFVSAESERQAIEQGKQSVENTLKSRVIQPNSPEKITYYAQPVERA